MHRGRDKVSCRGRDKSKVKELGGTAPPTLTTTPLLTCRPSQSLPRTRIPSFRCTRWGQLLRTPHLACPEAPGYQLPPPSLPPLLRRCAAVNLYKSLPLCFFDGILSQIILEVIEFHLRLILLATSLILSLFSLFISLSAFIVQTQNGSNSCRESSRSAARRGGSRGQPFRCSEGEKDEERKVVIEQNRSELCIIIVIIVQMKRRMHDSSKA
jgi:hypothetical protein